MKTALTTGSTQYPQWGLSWTYDRYGNRTAQTVTAGSGPSNAVTVSGTTNRITDPGYSYDANGNMTNDGLNALGYNAENRLVSAGSATYSSDGAGPRVNKISGGTTTVYVFSGTKVVAEYVNGAAPASPTREYIYSGSGLLATIEAGTTKYHLSDHLSARVTTDSSGNVLAQQAHYPFGETWYLGSGGTKWQFTSYERDAESGYDYAIFRYHVNRLRRFNSPDPLPGSLANPQSFNRYAYARNDPSNLTDPSGLATSFWEWIFSAENSTSFGGGSGILLAAQDYSLRESFGDRYYDLPSLFPRAAEQAEAEHTKRVTEAFLRQSLREVFKEHPECADLLGGSNKANNILSHLAVVDVNAANWAPRNAVERGAQRDIASGAVAETAVPHTGSLRTWDFKWTGGNFTVYVGSTFGGFDPGGQLTVLIHELTHVAAEGPAALSLDVRGPGQWAGNIYEIAKRCGTKVPPLPQE